MTDHSIESFSELSDDAKTVAGAWFGMGYKTVLNLHLRESRPTPRCQAALDELVAKKVLAVGPFNKFGGVTYKPLLDTRPMMTWLLKRGENDLGHFVLMEPIKKAAKGAPASK